MKSALNLSGVLSVTTEALLLDVRGAAAYLGVGIGVIRGWVADGLPFIRGGPGGKKLFTRRDLEKWVERLKESAA